MMAKRPRTEEMTEPPSDGTPSKRMRSVANVDFDDILKEIAKALHRNSDINDLGKALGFEPADIGRKIQENASQGGNYMGTLDLLRMWRNRQTPTTEKAALRSALVKARFDNLADQYLSTSVPVTSAESAKFTVQQTEDCSKNKGDDEAMPSEIMKLREQLKRRYRNKFGQIKTSPVDSESRTWLQHIYVSLVLMLGLAGEKEEPIDYDGLFEFLKTDTPKGFVTRLAFIGEAGVGKSTLFAKIALDWAEGKILQEINLLFLESFREITESRFFGDTVMAHFPDDSEIKGERVDEYIRKNLRKVLILLDGLDEAHIDIKKPNCNDAIVSIVRGDRFIDTPVVITTRPFGAAQIKSIMTINDHYTFGKVKGFTKKNMSTYINNYFKDDSPSALSLINFINTNQVVSHYMAPFPIFCCMLCCLWKTPSERESIQTMETFSQLLKRLVFSLKEQYSSKRNELEEDYESRMNKADESMKELGCIAFHGLLDKQLLFDEKAFGLCIKAATIACEVGILSMEKRPAPLHIRESQRKQFIQEFSFPHKLLQEYIASFYLALLFHKDCHKFNRILADTLLEDYEEFRYVLYFTAAHGGEVRKSVLETLCKKVDEMKFIIQVAFECHDSEAIDPVRNLLETKAHLTLDPPIAAYVFTLESIGKEVVRRSSLIHETLGVSKSFEVNASSSHVAAVGLFTLPNLQSLDFRGVPLDDEFYTGVSAAASQSKIEELWHETTNLGSAASSHYARGLCFMPHLRSLDLDNVELSDEFYSTMASEASNSKIKELTHTKADLGSAASSHYARGLCFMPHLQSLKLYDVKLSDEFYSTMASQASKSKIEELSHKTADLGSAASSHYARGLCFMPHLRSLDLDDVELSDEFYSTMASQASKSKIEELVHMNTDLGSAASSHYARVLCFMPNLRSLDLDDVKLSDEFYSTMASEASKSKIEKLMHRHADLGSAASSHYARGLCFMPNLRSLNLYNVKLSDEFYSMMASEASKSKTTYKCFHRVDRKLQSLISTVVPLRLHLAPLTASNVNKSWIPFMMANRRKTGEMIEPPCDDTPSIRMSSVANGDFDDILNDIAKALYRNSDINDLGKALGFGPAEIGRKVEENAKQGGNYMGTLQLLRMWRKRQTPLTEKAALRSVLLKAGFDNLADQYLSTPVLGEHGEMPDQVQRLREKLNARYIEEFSEVKVSPMDSASRTWLQQIFVSLILTLGYNKYQGQPLEYEDLFSFIQTKTDKGFITRVAFLGEAGVGKSTLFAKIALDWAMGKCLQDITLLFHETFRDIEDSPFFGNIVMNHFQDDTEIKGEWIDEYIKENQRKVLILLDGLDEAKMDIKCPNSELAIVLMARREKFIDTSVLISTRPFGAEQIISIPKINEKYSYIQVKGFTKENTNKYIKQFFGNDTASASSLIHFMNTNSVASQLMAPFPIFCSMLCYMWKVESKRETTEKLRAVSQLMKEIDFTLREQYSSRYTDNEEGYQSHMVEAAEAIVKVGSVAFEGLLKNQLIFTKEEMEACDKAAAIACQVGILRREKMTASRKIRQREGKQFIQEFCFPHKLLQEHIASLYLAWLYNHNRSEFNRILTHNLIKDYMAFRYVLYFTAAHGGEVGKSVLEALCKNPDNIRFIIEVAFECHDSEAINPVWNLLKTETNLALNDDIPITAYLYTLETIGREVVRRSPLISETLGVSKSFEAYATSSHVAVAIFTLQNLRWLEINSKLLDDRFYLGMYPAASKSKIEKLEHRHVDLGSAASSHYARGLCSMPDLRSLVLYDVKLTDEFYSTLASEASKSKIEKLEHWSADLGSAISSHYARGLCFMPNLRSLRLSMKLSDEFYSTMASESSKSKIEKLVHCNADLGSTASSHYARGLCSMPNLRSLLLYGMKLSDEFYSTMASEASKLKIEELDHWSADLGSAAASFHYARGLCFMPNLRSLSLYNMKLSDEFYSTLASEASKSKIEKLEHQCVDLGSAASSHYARGLCFMPHLRSLDLSYEKLSDEFYSTMASEASKSKIERIVDKSADLGSAASSHYARGLCFMPNLRSLRLYDVKLSDEFYSTMASEASKSKIQTLSIVSVSMMTPRRLHSILSLPRLQSLTLMEIGKIDMDDGETLIGQITSVDELRVDGRHVESLWKLGLDTSCPLVKKLELNWMDLEDVSLDTVLMACSPFHHLTHLHFDGSATLKYPDLFCDAIKISCPQLTKLSITHIGLCKKAAEIIQLMKTHPHLTSIELNKCGTNPDLDPLISEVNSEGKLTVTVRD